MPRRASTDFCKIVLATMVVGLHADIFKETSSYLSFVFVNGLFRIAVPIFFIINGFYFYSTVEKRRPLAPWMKRVALLYVVWMIIYLPLYYPKNPLSLKDDIAFSIKILVGYHHLWYLMASIGAGLLLYFVRKKSDKEILTTAIALFVIGSVIQYIFNYTFSSRLFFGELFNQYWVFRNFLFLGFPMYAIGYLFAKNGAINTSEDSIVLKMTILGLFALFLESSINYYLNPIRDHFDNYLSLLVACPMLFVFVQRKKKELKTDIFARISTGIYLTHPFFIFMMMKFTPLNQGTALFAAALSLSILASRILMKLDQTTKILF